MKRINPPPNVSMFVDKTRNTYECTPTDYEKTLKENVTKTYKIGSENMIDDINSELQTIPSDLSTSDRIETMARKEAFATVKDHKENFETNPKYRLINPAKSELGKVSKVILDETNERTRDATESHQWKNPLPVIDWFEKTSDKRNHPSLSFDTAEFYPPIPEDLLDKATNWAKNFATIPSQHTPIIKHARKSLLFNEGIPWVKRSNQQMFDVTMGSFDGAEICELVGLYILDELPLLFGKDYVGLYRDDGLLLPKSNSGRIADITRKKLLHQTSDKSGLKITVEVSHQPVNFLDITLNLADSSYHPYRKPNNNPSYISSRPNHPPATLKHLPESTNKRISQLSSDQDAFDSSAHLYTKTP